MNKMFFLAAVVATAVFTGSAFADELTAREKQIYDEIKAVGEDSIFYGTLSGISDSEYQRRLDDIINKYGISEADRKAILAKAAKGMTNEDLSLCEEAIVELAREQAKPGFTRESVDKVLGQIAAKWGIGVKELKDLVYRYSVL